MSEGGWGSCFGGGDRSSDGAASVVGIDPAVVMEVFEAAAASVVAIDPAVVMEVVEAAADSVVGIDPAVVVGG